VADLAYNDMDFLKHSPKHEPIQGPRTAYYRQRDHARRVRERQELSSFFVPKTQINAPDSSPVPENVDGPGMDDTSVLPDTFASWTSCSPRAQIFRSKQRRSPDTPEYSEPQTNFSPNSRAGRPLDHDDDSLCSPPPVHVREALRKTGVFHFRDIPHPGDGEIRSGERGAVGQLVHRPNLQNEQKYREPGQYKDQATMVTPEAQAPPPREKVDKTQDASQPTGAESGKAAHERDQGRGCEDRGKIGHPHSSSGRILEEQTREQQAAHARVPVYTHHACQTTETELAPTVLDTRQEGDLPAEQLSYQWAQQEPSPDLYERRLPSATSQAVSASTDAYSWVPHRPQSNSTSIPEYPPSWARCEETRDGPGWHQRPWGIGGEMMVRDEESLYDYIRRVEQEVLGQRSSALSPLRGSQGATMYGAPQTEEPGFGNVGHNYDATGRADSTRASYIVPDRGIRRVRFRTPRFEIEAGGRHGFESAYISADVGGGNMQQFEADGNPTTEIAPGLEAWDEHAWQEARRANDIDERLEMANFWGRSRLQQL
jgi:hypothetical protein